MAGDPDVRLLRYFVAVAEELHFARAAARLFIAQPSLSQQIRKLEGELGVALFHRDRRRVALTAAGQALLEPARRAIAAADQFSAEARSVRRRQAGPTVRLVLGFQVRLRDDGLARLVARHREQHPDVALGLRQYDFTDTSCGLVDGTADAAVLSLPVSHDVYAEPLFTEPVFALLPAAIPLAQAESATVADLVDTGLPWAEPLPSDPVWRDFWTAVPQRAALGNRGRVPTDSPPNVESYLQQVASGQLLGLTNESSARAIQPGLIRAVPVTDCPPVQFAIARRPADDRAELERLFRTTHDVLDRDRPTS